ncbi:MAG: aldehyde dehydrogenase family protein, partial [Candidatus Dormiibacterota bacterium]
MTTTTDSARSGDRLVQDQFYIGGAWTPSTSGTRINVHEAATGEVFAEVAEASEQDIDTAVKAAADAYPSWSATAVDDRLGYLEAISQGIADRTEDLARSIAREVGSPIRMARAVQVG